MAGPADFEDLKTFILSPGRMRMSHIYKPVMLQAVLQRGGRATRDEVAADIMSRDVFQLEHYARRIVHPMPGRRLVRDGILTLHGDSYCLAPPFDHLSRSQQLELISVCERRIEEFVESKGLPFLARNDDPVLGSVRYEVLKRAGGRCELCGVSHEEVPLDVDHIVPRARGGSNDESNLQALCKTCNAQKLDRDDTDFRAMRESFDHRDSACAFCEAEDRMLDGLDDELAYVIEDGYPVTPGHSLVIPRRHVMHYFELYQSERNAIDRLLQKRRSALLGDDPGIAGFNIGINVGEAAGQSVLHVHVHLIPRRAGDTDNPKGGVRGVIPARQHY